MTEEQCDNEFRRRLERGDYDAVIAETDKDYAEGRALDTLEPNAAPSGSQAGDGSLDPLVRVRRRWIAARNRWRDLKQQATRYRGLQQQVDDARLEMRMWAGALIYERQAL